MHKPWLQIRIGILSHRHITCSSALIFSIYSRDELKLFLERERQVASDFETTSSTILNSEFCHTTYIRTKRDANTKAIALDIKALLITVSL